MKLLDFQAEQKKQYQTPLLKNLGEVKELTKSEKGSVWDGGELSGRGDTGVGN